MTDTSTTQSSRGVSVTETWDTLCKDCRTASDEPATFSYSGEWKNRQIDRGQSRSDRCPECRKKHKTAIGAYAVAYVDVEAIGSVANPDEPSGPLGSLGPLPVQHERHTQEVDLATFQFGLDDKAIVKLLDGLSHGKRVAVFEAGTGTGKSTFAPFRLMKPPERPPRADRKPLYLPTDFGPIIVTEPRIPATTGVATFVGEQLVAGCRQQVCNRHGVFVPGGSEYEHAGGTDKCKVSSCTEHIGPGFPVGYQKSGEKCWDDACQLIYVTDGTLINWIRDGRLARIGMVIVDEAHERSENIDLILTLLRDELPRHPNLRVIIASATIDKNFFVQYFGGEERVHYQYAEAEKGVGYGVPFFPDLEVTDAIIANGLQDDPLLGPSLRHIDPWPKDPPEVRVHTRHVRELASKNEIPFEQWKTLMPAAVAEQVLRLVDGTDVESGDILAFLPTTKLINESCALIRNGLKKRANTTVMVYELLASIDEKQKQNALDPSSPGRRKVVVSSNLAETSLTVEGVKYVVDSGLICQSDWNPDIVRQTQPTIPHSQSGVRQRWGRVGRSAPGWVFPLYTRKQFSELQANTPAGSTQTNLEQFLVKLKAAGVDSIDDVKLPGNFSDDVYRPANQDAETARTFSAELKRAQRALAANGAIDKDGHLTSFGRELERFGGSPEHAMAIMFADRLACVPEVGMALSLLSDRLVDRRGLLTFDRDWPPAWRIHAAQCHRGLAAGCTDDLDLVITIAAAWQRADDPSRWAKQWCVNEAPLLEAESYMMDLVATLSPKMREEAKRQLDPRLTFRARAVLSRALVSVTYVPAAQAGTWHLEVDEESPIVEQTPSPLVPVMGRFIALSRHQPTDKQGKASGNPVVQGLVSVSEWAREPNAKGQVPDAFELLIRCSQRPRDSHVTAWDWQRQTFPVGTVVSVSEFDASHNLHEVTVVHDAPVFEQDLPNFDSAIDDSYEEEISEIRRHEARSAAEQAATFDVKGSKSRKAETPDEERDNTPRDLRELEHNDGPVIDITGTSSDVTTQAKPDRNSATTSITWQSSPLPYRIAHGVVVGYQDEGLVLQPLSEPKPLTFDCPDLPFGAVIDVTYAGHVSDHLSRFAILQVDRSNDIFFESEMSGALDVNNKGWFVDVPEGTRFAATVVPGYGARDPIGLTLLPNLRLQLPAGTPGQNADETWHTGVIEMPTSERDARYVVVDGTGTATAPFRFAVRASQVPTAAQGSNVHVLLKSWSVQLPSHPILSSEVLYEFAAEITADGDGWKTKGLGPMSEVLRLALLIHGPATLQWERAVWKCWVQSHRLKATYVRLREREGPAVGNIVNISEPTIEEIPVPALAGGLQITVDDVLEAMSDLGIPIRSHPATVRPHEANRLRSYLRDSKAAQERRAVARETQTHSPAESDLPKPDAFQSFASDGSLAFVDVIAAIAIGLATFLFINVAGFGPDPDAHLPILVEDSPVVNGHPLYGYWLGGGLTTFTVLTRLLLPFSRAGRWRSVVLALIYALLTCYGIVVAISFFTGTDSDGRGSGGGVLIGLVFAVPAFIILRLLTPSDHKMSSP